MKNFLVAHPLSRTLAVAIAAALFTAGAGHSALAAQARGFGGGARAGFGAPAARGFAGRGFAGRGFYGPRGRFGPYYGWGLGWGWGWGFGLGWYLPVLPLYYSTYWWDGVPYYYANDYYYEWNPTVGQYEAVVPPPGVTQQTQAGVAPALGAGGTSELFAYPKNGQSPAQQATDKEQCRAWARSQIGAPDNGNAAAGGSEPAPDAGAAASGSAPPGDASAVGALQQAAQGAPPPPADPPAAQPPNAQPPGTSSTAPTAAAAEAQDVQHSAYLRAEAACLEGRGYSVQ